MHVPLFDSRVELEPIRQEVAAAIDRVMVSGQFVLGEEVARFEEAVAAHLGVRYAVGVSSGSDALFLALCALDIGPGDEVVTTPFSFFASAGAIVRTGARPRFVDIEPETFNIDPDGIERVLTAQTKAIVAVHLFGGAAAVDSMLELVQGRDVALVEDAAQAFGATRNGRSVGTIGRAGCFSFFPSKPLGGVGDGGLVVTNDETLAKRWRRLRQHGARTRHLHEELGGNYRLDALQAAVLHVKLKHAEAARRAREAHAIAYDQALTATSAVRALARPAAGDRHAWAQYTVKAERRDELAAHLRRNGIETGIYYPRPLHLQPALGFLGGREGDLPISERAAKQTLSLPLFAGMTPPQRDHVIRSIQGFF